MKKLNFIRRTCCAVLAVVLTFSLCACAKNSEATPVSGTETDSESVAAPGSETVVEAPTKQYSVTFYDESGNPIESQYVDEGSFPVQVDYESAGLGVKYWRDENWNAVDVFDTAVTADAEYYAVMAPALTVHMQYLFPNSDGLIMPDAYLTYADLNSAIDVLTECNVSLLPLVYYFEVPEAENYSSEGETLTGTSGGAIGNTANDRDEVSGEDYGEAGQSVPVPTSEIADILSAFCGTGNIEYPESEYMTRRDFANLINTITERSGESAKLTADPLAFPDLPVDDPDYDTIMEAAYPHEQGSLRWSEAAINTKHTGFCYGNGRLYYVQEDGTTAKNTDVGLLHFDENGVFTSGNAELDGYVTEILIQLELENPGAGREELLRAAYNYCRDSFKYLRKESYSYGATGWEIEDAIEMFSTGKGNCYNYASTFWALSRALGYNSVCVSGTISSERYPHGWVIMNFDGEYYYFDCEMELSKHLDGEYDVDMFKMDAMTCVPWNYSRPQDIGI